MTQAYLRFTLLFLLSFLFDLNDVKAQSKSKPDSVIAITERTDLDELFRQARNLAYEKEYQQSRKILEAILAKKPDYFDVRTFLGRTYSWDGKYDEARAQFGLVLIEKPNDVEALGALIDVEIWSEQYAAAMEFARLALNYYPTSEMFILTKAKIEIKQADKAKAAFTLREVLEINPGNKEALKMLNDLGGTKRNNHLQVNYTTDYYDTRYPQHLAYFEFGKKFGFGSMALRVNGAERFQKQGLQYELDTYLNLVKGTYVYMNGGYSEDDIFPDIRLAWELFQKVSSGIELSAGVRYLQFSIPGTSIYTISGSNYYRNYWFSFRSYITPKSRQIDQDILRNSSQTYIISIRNYFGDSYNYAGVRLGTGQSPDERKLADINTARLESYSGAIELQKRITERWVLKTDLSYSHDEIRAQKFLQRLTVNTSAKFIF